MNEDNTFIKYLSLSEAIVRITSCGVYIINIDVNDNLLNHSSFKYMMDNGNLTGNVYTVCTLMCEKCT